MSSSAILKCSVREKLGSRDARKLRANGRVPASLQSVDEKPNLNVHLDEVEFLTSRRQHVHLYDLDIDGAVESAVVRELQWDALGDRINHIEFKRVQRGVETEAEVELSFYGQVKEGILNAEVHQILVRCLPSLIPDSIEVNVEGLDVGTHIQASELTLPEGVSLAVEPDLEIAVVAAIRTVEEPEEVEEEVTELPDVDAGDEKKTEDEG